MNETILATLGEFSLADYQPIFPRSLDLGEPLEPKAGNLVKAVVGMRRSGKSYRLFQEMQELIERGVSPERICYFNFEDDRLNPVTPRTGDEVLEAFLYLHPEAGEQGLYLFFDEMQEMQGWGAWLRRIVDTRKTTLYVSGSSSKMLSSEISTEFRGRALDFELLPLSFCEYLQFTGNATAADLKRPAFAQAKRPLLQRRFKDYLRRGGFPATLGLPESQAIGLLQSYVQRTVAADVAERHDVARPRLVSAFAQRALECNGRSVSIRKIENDFRSHGLATSRATLGDLLSYFEEAYLLFVVDERSRSFAEKSNVPPKLYAIDPGLARAVSRASADDEGQRLEDAVYLELRRRTVGMRQGAISSLRTQGHGYEIDFAVDDALSDKLMELYQVCMRADNEKTLERETRALWEAMDERGLEEARLIVGEGEDRIHERGSKRILQTPAWKWFVQGRAV